MLASENTLVAPVNPVSNQIAVSNGPKRMSSSTMNPEQNQVVPRIHGQGKVVATILAEQGGYVTIINDVPYLTRSKTMPVQHVHGQRPMHQSTLRIPHQPYTDYDTTNKRTIAASRQLMPHERSHRYPSQHTSQIHISHIGGKPELPLATNYDQTFYNKGAEHPTKLHFPSQTNKVAMNEGVGMRRVMTVRQEPPAFWTQYNSIHNKLGVLLGPGVPRERKIRQQYNVLTGGETGPGWHADNKRTSGNRILYHKFTRKEASNSFVLG